MKGLRRLATVPKPAQNLICSRQLSLGQQNKKKNICGTSEWGSNYSSETKNGHHNLLSRTRFERAPPKRAAPKAAALDHSATWTVFDHPIFGLPGSLCSKSSASRKWPVIPNGWLGFFWNQCAVLYESSTNYVSEQYRLCEWAVLRHSCSVKFYFDYFFLTRRSRQTCKQRFCFLSNTFWVFKSLNVFIFSI